MDYADEIPPDALIPTFAKKRGNRFTSREKRPYGLNDSINHAPKFRGQSRVSEKAKIPTYPHWREALKKAPATSGGGSQPAKPKKGRGDIIVEKHKNYNAFSQRAHRVEKLEYATGDQVDFPIALPKRVHHPAAISADISHLQDPPRTPPYRDRMRQTRATQRLWQAEVPAAVAGLLETNEDVLDIARRPIAPAKPVDEDNKGPIPKRSVRTAGEMLPRVHDSSSAYGELSGSGRHSPAAATRPATHAPRLDRLNPREVRAKLSEDSSVGTTQSVRERRPAGRRAVLMLEEYMNAELEREIEENADDPSELARSRHALYGQVFLELVRQVAVDCAERGQLLSRIWAANGDLFTRLSDITRTDRQRYVEALKSNDASLRDKMEEMRDRLSAELMGYKKDNEMLVKANEDLKRQFASLDEQVNIATSHKVKLEKDFQKLRTFLQDEISARHKVEEDMGTLRSELEDARAEKVQMQQEFEHQISIAQRRAMNVSQGGRAGARAAKLNASGGRSGLGAAPSGGGRARASSAWMDTREDSNRPLWFDIATQTEESAVRDMRQRNEMNSLGFATEEALTALATADARERIDSEFTGGSPRLAREHSIADSLGGSSVAGGKVGRRKEATEDFITLLKSLEKGGQKGTLRSKKWVGKMIDQIYAEKMFHDQLDDKEGRVRTTLPEYVVEFYLAKYGVRHLANECMLDLLTSVAAYDSHPKMKLFKRLCARRAMDALNYFLYVLSYVERNCAIHSMGDEGMIETTIAYSHAEQAVLSILGQLDESSKNSILVQIERACDSHNQIHLDRFLLIVLDEWDREMKRSSQRLKQLFHAGDINNDEVLSYDEFAELVTHVDDSISQRQVLSMFREALSQSSSHRDDITVDVFVRVMRKNGLGTLRPDAEVYAIDEQRMNENMKQLFVSDWESMSHVITRNIGQLELNSSIPPEEIDELQAKLAKLNVAMEDEDSLDHDPEEVWVLYRILMAQLNSTLLKYNDKNMSTREN